MNWFLIALISPALLAATNHIDKYLLTTYLKGRGVGALIIFSSIVGFFIFPFILIFQQNVWSISPLQVGIIFSGSVFYITATLLYLYALKKDEASIVVPLFQTIPIFGFILGYLFLGETLTIRQIIACVLIILGGLSLSLDVSEKRAKFKTNFFFLMLLSSFLLAAGGLTFKIVVIQTDYWTTNFWGYAGQALIGVLLFTFVKEYRGEFLNSLSHNRVFVLGLNGLNEFINVLGSFAMTFAFVLAPIALVQTVSGFQPFFVLLFGIILTLFFPRVGTESLLKRELAQKIIAITVMFVGTYILNT